jgi:membrane protease subunit HflC
MYTLDETQQAHLYVFGKPVGKKITEAGVHFKVPFIQNVRYYDDRWIAWEGDEDETTTRDKVMVVTNTFCRWKISDPLLYQQSVSGDEEMAQSRLDDIIDGATRRLIANSDLLEILRDTGRAMSISSIGSDDTTDISENDLSVVQTVQLSLEMGRSKMENEILRQSQEEVGRLGITVMDIRFIKMAYIASVRDKVFERMIAERERAAEHYRALGQGRKAEIEGQTEKEQKAIISAAFATSKVIRGRGDAEAAAIYNAAYKPHADFYKFYMALRATEASVDSSTTWYMSGKIKF